MLGLITRISKQNAECRDSTVFAQLHAYDGEMIRDGNDHMHDPEWFATIAPNMAVDAFDYDRRGNLVVRLIQAQKTLAAAERRFFSDVFTIMKIHNSIPYLSRASMTDLFRKAGFSEHDTRLVTAQAKAASTLGGLAAYQLGALPKESLKSGPVLHALDAVFDDPPAASLSDFDARPRARGARAMQNVLVQQLRGQLCILQERILSTRTGHGPQPSAHFDLSTAVSTPMLKSRFYIAQSAEHVIALLNHRKFQLDGHLRFHDLPKTDSSGSPTAAHHVARNLVNHHRSRARSDEDLDLADEGAQANWLESLFSELLKQHLKTKFDPSSNTLTDGPFRLEETGMHVSVCTCTHLLPYMHAFIFTGYRGGIPLVSVRPQRAGQLLTKPVSFRGKSSGVFEVCSPSCDARCQGRDVDHDPNCKGLQHDEDYQGPEWQLEHTTMLFIAIHGGFGDPQELNWQLMINLKKLIVQQGQKGLACEPVERKRTRAYI